MAQPSVLIEGVHEIQICLQQSRPRMKILLVPINTYLTSYIFVLHISNIHTVDLVHALWILDLIRLVHRVDFVHLDL